jgi:DNA-directed RNA polymerase specialized sigma24 family protein
VSDPRFRPQCELQLHRLSDDELIAYLRDTRASGDLDAARLALHILVFGYMDHVRSRIALKVPAPVVDEVAGHALISALSGAFRGESMGEFRSWLHVIVDRRIADFHRVGRLEIVPLVEEHSGLTSVGDETNAVAVRNVVESAMADLSDVHRAVIDRYVFDGLSADETSRVVAREFPTPPHPPISPANVHKIAQRFRDRLRASLESDTG